MSWRGDIATWCVTQIKRDVTQFREVVKAKSPNEIGQILNMSPSCVVIIAPATASDPGGGGGRFPDNTSEFVTFQVQIWYSSEEFQGIEDHDSHNGAYELHDAIYHALTDPTDDNPTVPKKPTGAYTPLRYVTGESNITDDGYVIENITFETGVILEAE